MPTAVDIDLAPLAEHTVSGDQAPPDACGDVPPAEQPPFAMPAVFAAPAARGFVAGTLIATPDAERPIETLSGGDTVLTADGPAMPLSAVRQTIAAPAPLVRIRAGALDENIPTRDLLVSSAHAVRVGKVLVQAGALVNGSSVLREPGEPTLFHLELDAHVLVIAHGVAAESFLDGVDDAAHGGHTARGTRGSMRELPNPRVRSTRQLPRPVREHLAARAARVAADTTRRVQASDSRGPVPHPGHAGAPQADGADDRNLIATLLAVPGLPALRTTLHALAGRTGPDLTVRELGTLLAVYMDDATHTVSSLAAALRIGRPALMRMVDRLIELDLVAREEDREDRRRVLVRRTARGAVFMRQLAAISSDVQDGRAVAAA